MTATPTTTARRSASDQSLTVNLVKAEIQNILARRKPTFTPEDVALEVTAAFEDTDVAIKGEVLVSDNFEQVTVTVVHHDGSEDLVEVKV